MVIGQKVYKLSPGLKIKIFMAFKFNLFKTFICISIMCVSINVLSQVDPGTDFDLNAYINQRLDAGEKTIVVPPGRYRVPEINNSHLSFSGRNDVSILADGVEMICTETVQAIKISDCHNFKLRGITVDYDPLPFTQGVIVELSSDKRTLTVDLIDGYSSRVIGDKLEIYDPGAGELVTVTYYSVTYDVDIETRRVVISKPSHYGLSISNEEIGDIAVLGSRGTKTVPHAIVPSRCTGLVLENVVLFSGPTFGFFETYCSGSQYIDCKVDRRPLETEIAERGMRRMRSNNADGFHSKHAQTGPSYVRCISRYNGDDGIAINGDYHVVTGNNGDKLSVVGKGGRATNLSIGDSVELVSYTGVRLPNAKILEIEPGPELTAEEKQFLQNQTFYAEAADSYKAPYVYYVTLDRSVYLPMGSVIASANRIGNTFEVRDCIMGPNRSRGILIKSSDGIITGNKLIDNWGQAIKLAPEYVWLEAGSGSNIIVSNNEISGCHDAAIAVYAEGGNGKIAPVGAHDNIQIIDNIIHGSTNPAIAVTSTSNLLLENNAIQSPNNNLLLPWIMDQFGRGSDPAREIYLNNFDIIYVTELSIDNCPDSDIIIGHTYDLDRTVGPQNATDFGTTWTSNDTSTATVDHRGVVSTLSTGTVAITLSSNDGNLTTQCTLNIVDPEPLRAGNDHQLTWKVYPNPAHGKLYIKGLDNGEKINIYSMTGRLVNSLVFEDLLKIQLAGGVYLIKVLRKNGQVETRKVVIKR